MGAVFVLKGAITINGSSKVGASELVTLGRKGQAVRIDADSDSALLILGGEPIEEPVVGYGPFVMSTEEELSQAFEDYRAGRMGRIRG